MAFALAPGPASRQKAWEIETTPVVLQCPVPAGQALRCASAPTTPTPSLNPDSSTLIPA